MEVLNPCDTLRRVGNPDGVQREARSTGCAIWLLPDPGCRKEALARRYENEPDAEKAMLFLDTAREESRTASPWLAPLSRDSPMKRWINDAKPSGWGLYLASDAPFDEMLVQLCNLVLIKRDGKTVIFRFSDGRVLTRTCQGMSEDDPQATTEGCIWRDYTCSQTTAVHQTDDFDYIPVLPRGKGGRP